MAAVLGRAIRGAGRAPKHLITDQGRAFTSSRFRRAGTRRGIRHRFGAVGQHGSIALMERWFLSLKTEFVDSTFAFLDVAEVERRVAGYVTWFRRHRPHQGLAGRTPEDARRGRPVRKPRTIGDGDRLVLERENLFDDPKLPVYRLKRAG
jgi:transposase InsO family protein